MPHREKASIIILACAGVLALIFGIWQINHNIKAPFKLKPIDKNLLSGDQMPDLQKDTDGDGLSDYEEANIYGTSPYLADTDSDGTPDSTELQNGTDPICPAGKDCGTAGETAAGAATSDLTMPPTEALPADNSVAIPTNLTASQVRELMKQAGMSDENLKKLDDKALLEIYNEALKASQ